LKKQDSSRSQADLVQQLQERTGHLNGLKDVYKNQEHIMRKPKRLASSKTSGGSNGNDDDEVLSLRQQQQASQQRIQSLERQVRGV